MDEVGSQVSLELDRLGEAVVAEHRCDPALLLGYLPALLAVATTSRRLSATEKRSCHGTGGQAARAGVALPALVDLYMTASRRLWPRLPELVGLARGRQVHPSELVGLGEAVWHAADDALAALAAGYLDAQRLLVRHEEAVRRQFVDDLLAGHPDVGSLVERAEPFGLNLAAAHLVAVARTEQSVDAAGRLTDWVEESARARFGSRGVLVTVKDGRLVCVLAATVPPGDSGSAAGQLGELTGSAATELTGGSSWRVGVSRPHAGPLGVARCYAEAQESIDLADRLELSDRVVHARSLLVYRVLLRDEAAMRDLVDVVLGPLVTAREGPDRLLQTLEAYFAAGGNTTAAARALHLSVRAMNYRLQRVADLTGYQAGDPAHQLPLHVAVNGARLLDWTPQQAGRD